MDHATPNLPARSFDRTIAFYAPLGFDVSWHAGHWLILKRGSLALEFFPYPDLDPATSSFSCCLRLDQLDEFVADCVNAGVEVKPTGWPRLHLPNVDSSGLRIGYLVDADGTLLRLVQNPPSE